MPHPPSRRVRRGKPVILACFAAALAAPSAPGCSGPARDPAAPVPTLAESPGSADAFGQLRRLWAGSSREERIALENDIRGLRVVYAREPVARVADIYLAWIALEKGDPEGARALALEAGRGSPGNSRDLATLVYGAALFRRGEPEGALERLLPLVGKLLDPYARALLHEEVVHAAVAARRWEDALEQLDIWLRDAPDEDQRTLEVIVTSVLQDVPPPSIEQALARMRAQDADEGAQIHAAPLEKAMAKRLAEVALARGDSALARRLLSRGGALSTLGDVGAEVVELASAGLDVPEVRGHRIGLLLPSASAELRSRGAQVSRGVMEALGASGQAEGRAGERLALRDDGASLTEARKALGALTVEGASLLIGGADPEESRVLAEFAEEEQVAAILIVPPSRSPDRARWSFVAGPSLDAASAPLVEALAARGARSIAVIGASGALVAPGEARVLPSVDCAPFAPPQGTRRYPIADWKAHGVDAVLLAGDVRCAEDALGEIREGRLRVLVGLGAEAAAAVLPPLPGSSPARRPAPAALVASLGCYPLDPSGKPSAELARRQESTRSRVTLWSVLGRDAGAAAALAVAALPEDATRDRAEVLRRRARVREALQAGVARGCAGGSLEPLPSAGPAWRVLAVK